MILPKLLDERFRTKGNRDASCITVVFNIYLHLKASPSGQWGILHVDRRRAWSWAGKNFHIRPCLGTMCPSLMTLTSTSHPIQLTDGLETVLSVCQQITSCQSTRRHTDVYCAAVFLSPIRGGNPRLAKAYRLHGAWFWNRHKHNSRRQKYDSASWFRLFRAQKSKMIWLRTRAASSIMRINISRWSHALRVQADQLNDSCGDGLIWVNRHYFWWDSVESEKVIILMR